MKQNKYVLNNTLCIMKGRAPGHYTGNLGQTYMYIPLAGHPGGPDDMPQPLQRSTTHSTTCLYGPRNFHRLHPQTIIYAYASRHVTQAGGGWHNPLLYKVRQLHCTSTAIWWMVWYTQLFPYSWAVWQPGTLTYLSICLCQSCLVTVDSHYLLPDWLQILGPSSQGTCTIQ